MFDEEVAVAKAAVVEACDICEEVWQTLSDDGTLSKEDRSPVTIADFAAQAIVHRHLRTAWPDALIVAEEDAETLASSPTIANGVLRHLVKRDASMTRETLLEVIGGGRHDGGGTGRFWTLDPIDGTKGFLRGDQYAVALALIENGEVVLGVLGCPRLAYAGTTVGGETGVLLAAVRGGGTWQCDLSSVDATQVRVTTETDPSRAIFCESVESGHTSHAASSAIVDRLGVAVDPVRIDSQCKYAVVARGEAGVYMRLPTRADYQEKIWDHAAGAIAVTEAGGQVSDIDGRPLDFSVGRTLASNRGVLATNRALHDPVLDAIRFSCKADISSPQ